jgi:hypothetical protein
MLCLRMCMFERRMRPWMRVSRLLPAYKQLNNINAHFLVQKDAIKYTCTS